MHPTIDSPSPRIRIFLVDDQSILRAAFKSLLSQDPRFEVVGDSGDAREAIRQAASLRPDVVLLDISMPGLSGLDAIGPLRAAHASMHILMLTHHEGESFVERALRAGADGYLSKDSDPAELALGIVAVHGARPYLSTKVVAGLVTRTRRGEPIPAHAGSRLSALTDRERETFDLLVLGHTNKDIARELGITLGTAKKHRENLQRKLECHSTAELARLAVREGLL